MKKAIVVDANDIKEIIAKHFDVSGTTLTITSSASSRSSSPGAFNNGYELVYVY